MYLSRIQLNPRRRDAWWLLSSPQRMHAAVLASFPDPQTGGRGDRPRILWRLDDENGRLFLYVVSPEQPDFAHLAEQAGWPTTERGMVKPYETLLDRLAEGQQWAFRLTANPTYYGTNHDTGRVQRYGALSVDGQQKWLIERAARHGFTVTTTARLGVDGSEIVTPDVAVTSRGVDGFERRAADDRGRGNRRDKVTLARARFDGRLQVTDADLLRRALTHGIGPAKAYGCGLLTLAQANG